MADGPVSRPENTLSGRVRRYARVSGTVGGLAARLAGAAFPRHRDRPAAARRGAARRARRAEGPADEGRPAARDHPRSPAQGVRRRARPAAVRGAAHGPPVRAPAHGGRARARLALQVQGVRARGRGRRLARPGPSRDSRTTAGALACKLQYPGIESAVEADLAQLGADLQPLSPLRPHDQSGADLRGAGRAPARGARLRARGQAHGALSPHAAGRGRGARARGAARALDPAPADHELARRPAAARVQGRAARAAQPHRLQHVPRLVRAVLRLRGDPRRPASRQLHRARRTSASTCSTSAASGCSGRAWCRA